MSGPKVVRIVTREELVDICLGHIARVNAALEDWTRIGLRNGCVSDADIAAARSRRDKLMALLEADRFMDVQKDAPREEGFLRDDLDARLAAAAERQAQARSRERRGAEAARTLLRALRDAGKTPDPELKRALDACADGKGDPKALSRGFTLLGAEKGNGLSAALKELAGKLKGDATNVTLAEWVAQNAIEEPDAAVTRLDVRLAEIARYVDGGSERGWRSRLASAEAETDPARRALMLDSLEIESGRALREFRARAQAASELAATLAELDAAGVAGREGFKVADGEATTGEIGSKTELARQKLAEHRAAAAAAKRREAVLGGLAALGYEVTEGMATSWVEDGRIVARSATRPDYGVEIAGNGSGERMQMRPVAFTVAGAGPDPVSDRDAETLWCGDVGVLQERLARAGSGLHIERSHPIGAVPLKRIEDGERRASNVAVSAPSHKLRTLG